MVAMRLTKVREFVKTAWVAAALGLPLAKASGLATYSWTAALLPIMAPAGFAACIAILAALGYALNRVGLAPFGRKR